ncbi:ABC transporter ATP-binding protein [Sinomonas cellulolyticus]|jgi:NitT/TauT family transport system ATP-binding protein|uniref:ABC transporter ATP-binding protein n=1 Tax=Sinomonas cellulolyticus TaxID=2801916 RepID=A0ABS1K739_9MICC|nr:MULTISPECIES: ABC transporter ATP-binding protein [Sinomonas]MBL0707393.1 ABC transporter ATP-binding protein [Sinomonas cellulolyticus]GHG51027.1 ABC transporter ATP-binding protein [Sinomonas sp. KCTC 49339]
MVTQTALGEYAVDLEGCTKEFTTPGGQTYCAVRDINLKVLPGRFVSVVGPTGSGKSTILNMAAGLLAPSEGIARSFGEPVKGVNRRASYMFQQDGLLPWKTVIDNVSLGLTMAGVGKADARAEAQRWLEKVGLRNFADRYPHQLSGGMRKRTAVAQAWIVNPDILLMDEPFSALDVQTRQIMENELLALWQESGKAVIFITHDLDEAIALSDEVVILGAGPGSTVVGSYEITIPRPRDLLEIRDDPRFVELHREIWGRLRVEVSKTYQSSAVSGGEVA